MDKKLSDMTLEELWKLFPIILKEHDAKYAEWYSEEKSALKNCVDQGYVKRINHIGSTAVKGLIAKPTVDILLEVSEECDAVNLKRILTDHGWTLMWEENEPDFKLVFNKGYTAVGFAEKVYHLHVRRFDDWDELYFRDYLRAHNDVAGKYADLKLKLMKQYEYNRDEYTQAKTEFILEYTKKARSEFGNRYLPKEEMHG